MSSLEFSESFYKAGFRTSREGEPHSLRPQIIAAQYPEIRSLNGYDPKTAWITLVIVVSMLLQALGIQKFHDEVGSTWQFFIPLILWIYCVGAVLNHWLAMTVHETSHNLALRTRSQNRWLAIFSNIPIILPMAMTFHRYHLEHHVDLGVDQKDSDLPHWVESETIGNSRILKAFWIFIYFFVYLIRGMTFARFPNRWEWINLAIQMTINALIYRKRSINQSVQWLRPLIS